MKCIFDLLQVLYALNIWYESFFSFLPLTFILLSVFSICMDIIHAVVRRVPCFWAKCPVYLTPSVSLIWEGVSEKYDVYRDTWERESCPLFDVFICKVCRWPCSGVYWCTWPLSLRFAPSPCWQTTIFGQRRPRPTGWHQRISTCVAASVARADQLLPQPTGMMTLSEQTGLKRQSPLLKSKHCLMSRKEQQFQFNYYYIASLLSMLNKNNFILLCFLVHRNWLSWFFNRNHFAILKWLYIYIIFGGAPTYRGSILTITVKEYKYMNYENFRNECMNWN